jgi:FdhE protein
VDRFTQSRQSIEQEARQCGVDFPDFLNVWPLLSRLFDLHHKARARPSASTWETEPPGVSGEKPLLRTLSPDKTALMEHARNVISTFRKASPETVPSPDALLELIETGTPEIVRDLPSDPAKCSREMGKAGVSPDVATLLLWAIFGPFFHEARESILESHDISGWPHGFCPVCGARPHAAKLRDEDGARVLECWLCGAEWQFLRLKCPFCGNVEQKTLGFFHLDEDMARRVHFCRGCGSYLKVFDIRALKRNPVLSVHNLATLHYDTAAVSEGFRPGSGLIWVDETARKQSEQ